MNHRCAFVVMLVSFSALASPVHGQNQGEKKEQLSIADEALLRKIVYTQGCAVGSVPDSANKLTFERRLVVPPEFERLYQKNRIAVLRVLLDIVKGGRADDALSAAAFALAKEKKDNPHAAVFCATYPRDIFDEDPGNIGSTYRQRLAAWLAKIAKENEK